MGAGLGEVIEKLRRSTVHVKAHRNGGGSGVVWSADGCIVTNAHVVEHARSAGVAEVEFWDGRILRGNITKRDRRRDLATIHVEASGLPAITVGDSNPLRPGEIVLAVGNPLGFTGAANTGVVHHVKADSWVVSQLRLAPGNSGGPLANASGELVGINTMIGGGLAFAIPSRSVADFQQAGAPAQTGLGVVVQPVVVEHASRLLGLIVLEVIPDSPADRASILQGDILVGVDRKDFRSAQDLGRAIYESRGGVLELRFRRGANKNIRTVTTQMNPVSVRAA
jgi:serine protease Do